MGELDEREIEIIRLALHRLRMNLHGLPDSVGPVCDKHAGFTDFGNDSIVKPSECEVAGLLNKVTFG